MARVKLLRFLWGRRIEYLTVMAHEFAPGWATWVAMWNQAWGLVRSRRITRRRWRERVKTCLRCPIYDVSLKRCRPYDGHGYGCGCWVPGVALLERPYPKGCWGKEHLGQHGIGWD
jgi:hypothetical protein